MIWSQQDKHLQGSCCEPCSCHKAYRRCLVSEMLFEHVAWCFLASVETAWSIGLSKIYGFWVWSPARQNAWTRNYENFGLNTGPGIFTLSSHLRASSHAWPHLHACCLTSSTRDSFRDALHETGHTAECFTDPSPLCVTMCWLSVLVMLANCAPTFTHYRLPASHPLDLEAAFHGQKSCVCLVFVVCAIAGLFASGSKARASHVRSITYENVGRYSSLTLWWMHRLEEFGTAPPGLAKKNDLGRGQQRKCPRLYIPCAYGYAQ